MEYRETGSVRINDSVQPELLINDSNDDFLECNAIRARTAIGLEIGFLDPVAYGVPDAQDA